jgi:hypothetical protein
MSVRKKVVFTASAVNNGIVIVLPGGRSQQRVRKAAGSDLDTVGSFKGVSFAAPSVVAQRLQI